MVKWGKRKPSLASSSRPSPISNLSPFSWLSKFKQMSINSAPDPAKSKQKVKKHSPSVSSSKYACRNGGRFYGCDDEDAFWRLSFSEEGHDKKKNTDILNTLCDTSEYKHAVPSSSCCKKHGRKEESINSNEKDMDLREGWKLPKDTKISMEMDESDRDKEFENLKRRFDQKTERVLQEQLLKLQGGAEEAEFASTKSEEKDVLKFGSPGTIRTPITHSSSPCLDSKNSRHRNIREDAALSTSERKLGSKWQYMKQIEELKSKTEKERKSLHVSREIQRRKPKHSPKVRVYSPRTASKVEICKIKAIEDMRKAKLKMMKAKEKIVEEETEAGLDSFAVVKCSLNPQQDFRVSMVEMIKEKQISQPKDMEELLACYLTLNSDEYHDLIIKVFRQVWFDMNLDNLRY